jgi:hypothetical protein
LILRMRGEVAGGRSERLKAELVAALAGAGGALFGGRPCVMPV